jgi:hypothetical protein
VNGNKPTPPRWRDELMLGFGIALVLLLPLAAVTCAAWGVR